MQGKTLYEKLWQRHLVQEETAEHPAILYIDRHLVHEVTSPQAFAALAARGLKVRRPERTFATLDHSVPTDQARAQYADESARNQVMTLRDNCRAHGIRLFDLSQREQGIVHVIGPELGLTLPGMTVVCGDSHTSTHGAFGALAFGIGTSEVAHVLATQCLLQRRAKTMAVNVHGRLAPGVVAKDLALAVIRALGSGGGAGYVLEYRGQAVRELDMEGRMTLCNMSIEAGARAGLIGVDDETIRYCEGREFAPRGEDFERAAAAWRELRSDADAVFDAEITLDAGDIAPMVTFGTSPDQAIGFGELVPQGAEAAALEGALRYMRLKGGQALTGTTVDVVFIGSCTNGRLADLRAAASLLRGRQKAAHVRLLVVPGSAAVKRQAEAEGLDQIFRAAGAEWREPGCSMCIAMNGDQLAPGQLAVSTSNRNFAGRQGRQSRTVLASPLTAAAAAIAGKIADPRGFLY